MGIKMVSKEKYNEMFWSEFETSIKEHRSAFRFLYFQYPKTKIDNIVMIEQL